MQEIFILKNLVKTSEFGNLEQISISMITTNSTPNGRPSHLISPKDKDKEWILQMIKCIHADYQKFSPNLFFNSVYSLNENVRYFNALNNPSDYMDYYDQNQSETKNLNPLNRDKRILNIASKYIRILNGRLNDLDFDITVTPANYLARKQEEEYMTRIRAAMKMKEIIERNDLAELNRIMVEDLGYDELPDSMDELEIQRTNSIPWMMSTYIEMFLNNANSKVDDLKKKLDEQDINVITMGCYATKCYTNREGVPVTENIDPRTLLVGYSNTEDFRDVSEIGQYRVVDINTLQEEDQDGCLSKEDLEDIAKKARNSDLYPIGDQNFLNDPYFTNRFLVLDCYFFSWDQEVYLYKKNKMGNPRIYPKNFDYYLNNDKGFKTNHPDKELYRINNQCVYKGTWIVGTDYIYNYGLLRDTARLQSDPYKTKLPIVIHAPLIKDGRLHSMMDEIKPIIDSIQIIWQRIQEAIAKALPPGSAIDIDALLGAVANLNDKNYTIQKTLELALKENIHIYSGSAIKHGGNGAKFAQEIYGGLGPDFVSWTNALRENIALIQEITGFSSVAAGSPDKYMGKGVGDQVMTTADFSIRHLYEAKRRHFRDICKLKVQLGMDLIASGKAVGVKRSLGEDAFEYMQIHSDASKYEYDLSIDIKPTSQEWAELYAAARDAMRVPPEQGGIDYSDYIEITECSTIKQAKTYLKLKIDKNKKKAERQQRAIMEQKAELDRQTAEQSAQIRIAEQKAITEQLAIQEDIKTKAKMAINDQLFNQELEKMKLQSLIQSAQLQTEGQIEKEITQIKANSNMDRLRGPGK
jgi:hypothetical protein